MKAGDKVILKIKNTKTYVDVKNNDRKSKLVKCRILKIYPHFILVQRGYTRECFLTADFLTKDIQVLNS